LSRPLAGRHGSQDFKHGATPILKARPSFQSWQPARTGCATHADRCARLPRKVLAPVRPLCSIRRPQGRGVCRPIAFPACQLLGPAAICRNVSAVRSRRPAASELASKSTHLRFPGGISGPAGNSARGTRASSRRSRVVMHSIAPIWPANPVELLWEPRATCRCEARVAVPTERRRRCAHAAPILPYSGLSCVWGVHASLELCRSLLPLAFDLEKSSDVAGARRMARASRAHPTSSWHWSRIGMGLGLLLLEHTCAVSIYLNCRCRCSLCTVEVATHGYVVRRIYSVYSSESSTALPLYGSLGGV
jgi:hypothetical protein